MDDLYHCTTEWILNTINWNKYSMKIIKNKVIYQPYQSFNEATRLVQKKAF